jgi:hypothetical protein
MNSGEASRLSKEEERDEREDRDEDRHREFENITKESWRLDAGVVGDGLYEEVWAVAYISERAKKRRA